jgi:hypothetical protein
MRVRHPSFLSSIFWRKSLSKVWENSSLGIQLQPIKDTPEPSEREVQGRDACWLVYSTNEPKLTSPSSKMPSENSSLIKVHGPKGVPKLFNAVFGSHYFPAAFHSEAGKTSHVAFIPSTLQSERCGWQYTWEDRLARSLEWHEKAYSFFVMVIVNSKPERARHRSCTLSLKRTAPNLRRIKGFPDVTQASDTTWVEDLHYMMAISYCPLLN